MSGPELNLWWGLREQSQSEDARSLARFVSELPAFDSIYESWLESPKTKKKVVPVPLMEDEAKRLLAKTLGRYDDGGPWPEIGSSIRGGHAGPPPYDFRKSSYADTSCSIGHFGRSASAVPNHIFMRLSELRPSTGRPWRASELRPLMKFAREIWNPAEMCALLSFGSDYLPEIPDPNWAARKRTLNPWIGWITYLPPDLAARAMVPTDTHVETLDDGAALVTLCEEPFDKTDREGMARLHALEAALRPIQS
ncbi:immunity protein 52 of polymorphic toxin system [Roseiarcus fermentans]|uniref:Immunity protein 52 of polymorphic toxin system n=1 Tax=Roseiarcus fermentans TaxID=1473586 RepID=A0A366EQD5_9HYPH|nr:Imm52 family immunity protein [Roseiarcus fermentans]RBP04581.1 immunity protein 52 of polymorphic toxin system [Roseiarcus fermentans]